MATKTRRTWEAELQDVRCFFAAQHPTEADDVEAIIAASMLPSGEVSWTMPPVLVLDNEGNGYTILDGHHRCEAAKRLGLHSIPAYVLSIPDYCALVAEHFGGEMPSRLADLWDYITVDGQPYDGGQ